MTCPLTTEYKRGPIRIQKRKLAEKNMANIANDRNIDWSWLEHITSANDCYQLFQDHLLNVVNYYIEEVTLHIPRKEIIREPWLTRGIVNTNKKQLTLYKAWLQNKNAINHDRYKQYQDTLRKIKRRQKFEYYNIQCERYKWNSKKLWGIINEVCGKCTDKTSSLHYILVDGIKHYNSSKITNEFADFFSSVGAQYSSRVVPSKLSIVNYLQKIPRKSKSIFLIPCTPQEIRKLISNLKNKQSSGHDGITNILLKKIMDSIAKPLSYIFNKSLSQGIFPDIMKIAEVVPLHKSGNPHIIDNYRPISLLMTISKILEKLIYSHVYTFLDNSGQIYDSQYGFRSKHSCEHGISELVGNILKGKEKGDHTISVFLDLSKAFDTLEYSTLFKKMEIYGIRG